VVFFLEIGVVFEDVVISKLNLFVQIEMHLLNPLAYVILNLEDLSGVVFILLFEGRDLRGFLSLGQVVHLFGRLVMLKEELLRAGGQRLALDSIFKTV